MSNTTTAGAFSVDAVGLVVARDIGVKTFLVSPTAGGASGYTAILKDNNGKVILNVVSHIGISVTVPANTTFAGITADTLTNATVIAYV